MGPIRVGFRVKQVLVRQGTYREQEKSYLEGPDQTYGFLIHCPDIGKTARKKKTLCFHGSYVLMGEETVYKPVYKKVSTGGEGKVQRKRYLGTAD